MTLDVSGRPDDPFSLSNAPTPPVRALLLDASTRPDIVRRTSYIFTI